MILDAFLLADPHLEILGKDEEGRRVRLVMMMMMVMIYM